MHSLKDVLIFQKETYFWETVFWENDLLGKLPSVKLTFWETVVLGNFLLGKILWEITSGKHPNISSTYNLKLFQCLTLTSTEVESNTTA